MKSERWQPGVMYKYLQAASGSASKRAELTVCN